MGKFDLFVFKQISTCVSNPYMMLSYIKVKDIKTIKIKKASKFESAVLLHDKSV